MTWTVVEGKNIYLDLHEIVDIAVKNFQAKYETNFQYKYDDTEPYTCESSSHLVGFIYFFNCK